MTTAIRLIVGLGNPGAQYEVTRHNAGFWLIDHIADDFNTRFTADKTMFAETAKARSDEGVIVLAKPTTFMNRSGQSVAALLNFYKFSAEQVLVLHDELDLLPGQAKLKQGGGHAGHNGLRDIQKAIGGNFWRLRIGIGHPRNLGLEQAVAAFVLKAPRNEELSAIESVIIRCREIVPSLLDGNFSKAIHTLHSGNA